MRYYEVKLPDEKEPRIVTNARKLRDLPEGTRVFHIVTDRDGSLVDEEEYPVENGRVKFPGSNKRTPKLR